MTQCFKEETRSGSDEKKSAERQKYELLIVELIDTIDLCLESEALTWESEQQADVVCRKAKVIISNIG